MKPQRTQRTREEERVNGISEQIIGAAIAVHRTLGPGLLESAYEACLIHELTKRKLFIERQKALPVVYEGVRIDCGYRLDVVVEEKVSIELKSIETLLPIHEAQLLSYLKLSGIQVGLLINFNVRFLKDCIRRLVVDFKDKPFLCALRALCGKSSSHSRVDYAIRSLITFPATSVSRMLRPEWK